MDLSRLLLVVLLGAALLVLALWGYLVFYQRRIDQALTQGRSCRWFPPPYVVRNVLAALLAAVILVMLSGISVPLSAKGLEREAAERAKEEGKIAEIVIDRGLGAVLWYNAAKNDHTFALYENRGKVMEDYTFLHGGSSSSIGDAMRLFRFADGREALFSMNAMGAASVTCKDGTSYEINPDAPFVLILSEFDKCYDENGCALGEEIWCEVTQK